MYPTLSGLWWPITKYIQYSCALSILIFFWFLEKAKFFPPSRALLCSLPQNVFLNPLFTGFDLSVFSFNSNSSIEAFAIHSISRTFSTIFHLYLLSVPLVFIKIGNIFICEGHNKCFLVDYSFDKCMKHLYCDRHMFGCSLHIGIIEGYEIIVKWITIRPRVTITLLSEFWGQESNSWEAKILFQKVCTHFLRQEVQNKAHYLNYKPSF